MGRPPGNGTPSFRFTCSEATEMEAVLQQHNTQLPAHEVILALAEKFSSSPERSGKITVQVKQVWNWFQNRRHALRAKAAKESEQLTVPTMPQYGTTNMPYVPRHVQCPTPSVQFAGHRTTSENSPREFEARSAKDGAWYDVAVFLSYRPLETGDTEVLTRFSGLGPDEDEWINVPKHVRQRSLPCESSECVLVNPGDPILCFQDGKDQALYFDAHVLDSQRRRHDARGCRCRFLVRYDHDLSEEIVPLQKVCRRPETDYRLHLLNASDVTVKKRAEHADDTFKPSPFHGNNTPDSADIKIPKPEIEQIDR